jgi:hypothetical protein
MADSVGVSRPAKTLASGSPLLGRADFVALDLWVRHHADLVTAGFVLAEFAEARNSVGKLWTSTNDVLVLIELEHRLASPASVRRSKSDGSGSTSLLQPRTIPVPCRVTRCHFSQHCRAAAIT